MQNKSKIKSYEEFNNNLEKIISEPEEFLRPQPEKCNDIKNILQEIYKNSTQRDVVNRRNVNILPELVLEDMDEEQIWQQLELRNNIVLPQFIEQSAKLLALRNDKFNIKSSDAKSSNAKENTKSVKQNGSHAYKYEKVISEDEVDDDGEDDVDDDDDDDDDEENESEENDIDEDEEGLAFGEPKRKKKKLRSSIVDDKFFKLSEMEEFLEAEDEKEMRKTMKNNRALNDTDGINYFDENLGAFEDSDNESNPNYRDFFDSEPDDDNNDKRDTDFFRNREFNENEGDDDDELNDVRNEIIGKGRKKSRDLEVDDNSDNNDDENEETDDDYEGDDDVTDGKIVKKLKSNRSIAEDSDDDNDEDDDEDADDDDDDEEALENDGKQDYFAENDEEPKSSHEQRNERLKARIEDFHQEMLGEKSWQLKGEIQAANRPQNSLLAEVLEFDSTSRPAPVITEQTTLCLEDLIKQRIKDQAWDDVEAKVRPIQTAQEFRKQLVLDQEKSKVSLAELYAQEYEKEMSKFDQNQGDTIQVDAKEIQEVKNLMNNLFIKLDALSNLHFTPKPVAPEARIITNIPAISMEEVAPVAVSDAKLLAPKEVYRGPKHELVGKTERTRTDKNRERRKKKQKQKAIQHALEAKDARRQKLGIPLTKKEEQAKLLKTITKHRNVEKVTASTDQKALKSSKAFFNRLQDTTTGINAKVIKKKPDAKSLSAKKLKL